MWSKAKIERERDQYKILVPKDNLTQNTNPRKSKVRTKKKIAKSKREQKQIVGAMQRKREEKKKVPSEM